VADSPRVPFVIRHWRTLALALGAVVLVALALDVFLIRPMVSVSGDREVILAARRTELRQVAEEVAALERTASKIACTRGDVRRVFEDMLSSKSERMTAILREIRQLAINHRMDPESLQIVRQPVHGGGLVRFTVAFPLEGSYETLREFVLQVESSDNFLMIENVSLADQKSQGRNLQMAVRVATYFRDPDLARLDAVFARKGRRR
jgi:Tfp pilus assembly protein PilO